jgi:hypothetical protein
MAKTITLAAMATLLVACNSSGPTDPSAGTPRPSFAADHTTQGTPGAANCRGQTAAFVAQAAKNGIEDDITSRGLGGVARDLGLTTAEVQAAIVVLCAAP